MGREVTNIKVLNDVCIMRPIAILLLVVWHSFIIYAGGWRKPVGFQSVECYWWLAKLSYAFMLELFVFVSGYVFGLALEYKHLSFKTLLINKFKRLIIPSLIFGTIYYLIFYNLDNFTVVGFVWKVLNGCAHMWFLPMLFWVTLMAFGLDKLRLPQWFKLVGVCCFPALAVLPLPLGLSEAMYYIPIFYIGILIYKSRKLIVGYLCKHLIRGLLLGLVFILLFVVLIVVNRDILSVSLESNSLIARGLGAIGRRYMQLICAASGVAFAFFVVNYVMETKNITIPKWIIELNGVCFGIYLFQQFILQILYYKTALPTLVGPYWLPWVGLIVTLVCSYLLTKLSLKTKIGRQLM